MLTTSSILFLAFFFVNYAYAFVGSFTTTRTHLSKHSAHAAISPVHPPVSSYQSARNSKLRRSTSLYHVRTSPTSPQNPNVQYPKHLRVPYSHPSAGSFNHNASSNVSAIESTKVDGTKGTCSQKINWEDPILLQKLKSYRQMLDSRFVKLFLKKKQQFDVKKPKPETIKFFGIGFHVEKEEHQITIPTTDKFKVASIAAVNSTTLRITVKHPGVFRLLMKHRIKYHKEEKFIKALGREVCPWQVNFWERCPKYNVEMDSEVQVKNMELQFDFRLDICECREKSAWESFSTVIQYLYAFSRRGVDGVAEKMLQPISFIKLVNTDVKYDERSIVYQADYQYDNTQRAAVRNLQLILREKFLNYGIPAFFWKVLGQQHKNMVNGALRSLNPSFKEMCSV